MNSRGFFRLIGILLIALSVAVIIVSRYGETQMERDITAAIMLAPVGIRLLFVKESEG